MRLNLISKLLTSKYRLQVILFTFLTIVFYGKTMAPGVYCRIKGVKEADYCRYYPLSGDEPNYLMDAISMGIFHTRDSYKLYYDPEIVTTIYPSPILYPHVVGDAQVSYHGVGLSILLIPAVFFASKVLVAKIIVSLIAAASITVIFDLTLRVTDWIHSKITFVVFIVIGLTGPVLFNANQLYPEYLCLLLVAIPLSIVYRKSESSLKLGSLLIILFCLNSIWWLNVRYIPLAIAAQISFLIYFLNKMAKKIGSNNSKRFLLITFVFTALNILIITSFYRKWYGTANLFFISELQPTGLRVGDFAAVYRTAGTYIFGQTEGLIPWAPFFVLVAPGCAILWFRFRFKLFYIAFPLALYFGTIIQAAALGGSVVPLHYMALLVPFLGIPLAAFFVSYANRHYVSRKSLTYVNSRASSKQKSLANVKEATVALAIAVSIVWSLALSASGVRNEGYLYMRSASQESPILPLAKVGTSFWPHYLSPNKDNGSLGVPPITTWINKDGNLTSVFSQGYRSAGAYQATIDITSNTEVPIEFSLSVGKNSQSGVTEIDSAKFEIAPRENTQISLPFQIYETSEIVWSLKSNVDLGFTINESDMRVLNQQRPSGFSDLGFTILALFVLLSLFRRELENQTSGKKELKAE